MATQAPQTLQDIQDAIHVITNSDPDTPAATDDQWKTRLVLINLAYRRWQRKDVNWDEVFKTYDGDTIAAGTQQYTISDNTFASPQSLLRLYTPGSPSPEYIDVIKPSKMLEYQGSGRVAYFTGNPRDGYTLNLGWNPTAADDGKTFNFDFNITVDRLVNPKDVPILADPDYIIQFVSAKELRANGRGTVADDCQAEADMIMQDMQIRNEMAPDYASNALIDVDAPRNNDIWGE